VPSMIKAYLACLTVYVGSAQPLLAERKMCEVHPHIFCHFYSYIPRPSHLQVGFRGFT
jgi:hypothetical protein